MNDPHGQKGDDLGFAVPEPARLTPTRAIALVALACAILGGAFVAGYLPKRRARQALENEARSTQAAVPRVEVIAPKEGSSDRSIVLPGSVQPLEETVIYPRASGYLRKWYFDIGAKVKEGDLLAEIDTPELDQQLAQARAQLAQAEAGLTQARANSEYSRQQLDRFQKLAPSGVASQQDLDKQNAQFTVDQANVTVAQANADAMRANIQRLVQLKSFARVVAPFAGTITARTVDRGALVTDGNGTPLFRIAALDPVRVFVQVPQDVAGGVRVDQPATVTVREKPDRLFQGKVAHAAGALDSTTRTMLTEVRVPNPEGELMTGMYARVSLTLPEPHKVFEVPATALLSDAKGLRVAVVGQDDVVHLVTIVEERDTGASIEVASGLEGGERIVKVVSPDLTDGRAVEVVKP